MISKELTIKDDEGNILLFKYADDLIELWDGDNLIWIFDHHDGAAIIGWMSSL